MVEPASYEADIEVAAAGSVIGDRTVKLHVTATRGPGSSATYSVTPNIPGGFPVALVVDSTGAISAPTLDGLTLRRRGSTAAAGDTAIKALFGLGRDRASRRGQPGKSASGLRFVSTATTAQFRTLAGTLRSRATRIVEGATEVTYTGQQGGMTFETRMDRSSDAPVFQRMQWTDGRVMELSQSFDHVGNGVFARVRMNARVEDSKGERSFGTKITNLVIHGAQR